MAPSGEKGNISDLFPFVFGFENYIEMPMEKQSVSLGLFYLLANRYFWVWIFWYVPDTGARLRNFLQSQFCFYFVSFPALRALVFCIQFDSALAYPACLAGGVAGHQGMSRNISGDDRAGGDEGIVANGVAANNGGVSAKRRSLFNQRGFDFRHSPDFRARIDDIGENDRRPAEYGIF